VIAGVLPSHRGRRTWFSNRASSKPGTENENCHANRRAEHYCSQGLQGVAQGFARRHAGARGGFGKIARAIARSHRSRKAVARSYYRAARKAGASRGMARGFATVSSSRIASAAGAIGPALGVVLAFGKQLRDMAEARLDANRPLAPYSGQLATGFAMLELADMMRSIKLARHAQGSAMGLIGDVNQLRDSELGFEKLGLSLSNRVGRGLAAWVAPGFKSLGDAAGDLADRIEKADPTGKFLARPGEMAHEAWARSVSWWTTLFTTGSRSEADKYAREAVEEVRRARDAGALPMTDGWTEFMRSARSIPIAPPARPMP
jgi:hypothetical protein